MRVKSMEKNVCSGYFWQKLKSWWAKDTDKQELTYRKQIACQLRTQYVEGIYDNPVTLNF